ncbi:MAG: DNA primase [Lachnospiraceae bacterium]|nr:DNA primase [Lachnospiraceae bacterium]
MFYSEDLVEEIRSRNDIVDVINSYVSLKKKGNTYTACCPFHNEKTPSFHVSREKQLYHCFGCGAARTVYTFLQQYENYTFPESVEYLAKRAGIQLPQREMTLQERKEADYNSALKEINKAAAGYFYYALRQKNGEAAMTYLTERGLSQETIHKFGLGYSNMYRDDLYQYLKKKGYDDKLLIDSGLVRHDERQGVNDVFWNRVMFPIMDLNGKVIGFGGRVLGDGLPKYVNSQETKIYEKRRHLYGFHLARRSRREGFILCEGYMDVIAMHQAGFDNATASLGTAFTIQQALLLRRFANKVYLAYDSDGAGTAAALKAIPILREVGLSARIINMQPYKDPDEFIKAMGAEAFEERIRQSESSVMYQVRVASKKYNQQDPESRTEFQQEAAKIIAALPEPLERDNYIEAVSNQYFMDKKKLTDLVNRSGRYMIEQKQYQEAAQEMKPQDMRRQERAEERKQQPQRLLLTWLVNCPTELFPQLRGRIGPEDFTDTFCQDLARQLFQQYEQDGSVQPAKIINQFEDVEEQMRVASILQTELKMAPSPEDNSIVITEIVRKVKEESLQYQLAHLQDYSKLQDIIKQKSEIPNWNISLTCG